MRPLRKGDRVATSGKGRTASWPRSTGTVTRRRGDSVFVQWDRSIVNDEMSAAELVRL